MSSFKGFMGAVLLTLCLMNNVAARDTIVIGDQAWAASHAISNILKVVIEKELDANVKIVSTDQALLFESMDRGDGSMDVHPDLWIPNSIDYWNKYIAKGSRESILVNDKPYVGNQGMYVPGYVQDTYNIKNIEQLKNPEIAKLFDNDDSGKGTWWAGAPGWSVTNVELVRAKSYGYDKTFKPRIISDEALRADLDLAFALEQPVAFYYWEPEGLFKKYDIRRIEEPPYKEDCYKMVAATESAEWKEKSQVTCGYPPATIYVAYSKSLTKRAPKIAQFLKQVSFDIATLNDLILQINEKEDPYELAKKWVKENTVIVKKWLKDTNV